MSSSGDVILGLKLQTAVDLRNMFSAKSYVPTKLVAGFAVLYFEDVLPLIQEASLLIVKCL